MPSSQAQVAEQPHKMTYEEFLDWCDEDDLAEWVDGNVVMTSPVSKPHQTVVDFLVKVLGIYSERQRTAGARPCAQCPVQSNDPGKIRRLELSQCCASEKIPPVQLYQK